MNGYLTMMEEFVCGFCPLVGHPKANLSLLMGQMKSNSQDPNQGEEIKV